MMRASKILTLSILDFSELLSLLIFRGVETVFLVFRDFVGALLMGYYMHFPGYLANGIGSISRGYFETRLANSIYEY